MKSDKPIYVTRPSLPPLEEFVESLKKIWDSGWLTNNGPFHEQLEKQLVDFLGVRYLSLFSNGTLALITALQALRITGEVITTPYSFVATTHSLWWNGIKPVFVDIDPVTCNLDPAKIESAITPKTTAIMPVHVYGTPCDIAEIQKIADIYGLKVIYDAAHAFGVKINDNSVLNFGDLSILSFHATKVFNTIEGGAVICHDAATKKRIDFLKNFGFADEVTVVAPGINAKMNELQCAFGLLQMNYHYENVSKRQVIDQLYRDQLAGVKGITCLPVDQVQCANYSYFPVTVDEKLFGKNRDTLYEILKTNNVFARRYFFPLISHFPTYQSLDSANPRNLKVAEKISSEVLCLPIFSDMKTAEVEYIVKIIKNG